MSTTIPVITSLEQILGKSCSREEVLNSLKQHPESYAIFSSFRPEHQNTILSFMQGQRSDCYTADMIMRQYNRVRSEKSEKFSYKDIAVFRNKTNN